MPLVVLAIPPASIYYSHGVQVISNRHQATTILCTTSLIRTITPKLGRVLGPLGLMPSERRGTVTDDIAGYIQRLYGTSEWRADKSGSIHTAIAKVRCLLSPSCGVLMSLKLHFPIDDVVKNVRHFMTSVKRVTGNQRDKEDKKTAKPGKYFTHPTSDLSEFAFHPSYLHIQSNAQFRTRARHSNF